jgi:hypothetical protein
MWTFFILVSLGLAFMLYALVQLLRDGKRRPSGFQQSSRPKAGNTQTPRVVRMDSAIAERKDPFSKTTHRRMDSREWGNSGPEYQQ